MTQLFTARWPNHPPFTVEARNSEHARQTVAELLPDRGRPAQVTREGEW
jgi:hypothetical protein